MRDELAEVMEGRRRRRASSLEREADRPLGARELGDCWKPRAVQRELAERDTRADRRVALVAGELVELLDVSGYALERVDERHVPAYAAVARSLGSKVL